MFLVHVINAQSVNFTGTQDHVYSSGNSYVDITDLSITMTPSSATSKFLVTANITCSNDAHFVYLRFVRNGTAIITPDGSGSFNRQTSHFATSDTNNGSTAYVMNVIPRSSSFRCTKYYIKCYIQGSIY